MSRRLLRDPQLSSEWNAELATCGFDVLEASARDPAGLLEEARAREAVLVSADPAVLEARCAVRAPLPSVVIVPPERVDGLQRWLEEHADGWSTGLLLKVRPKLSCHVRALTALWHEGELVVGEHTLVWRSELRRSTAEEWCDLASVWLVFRAAPGTGGALLLPLECDARPTAAELLLAARVGLVHGWVPGADQPDLRVQFYAWAGADDLKVCPCCDYRTLRTRGDYHMCPVCGWEDDGTHAAHLDDYASCNGRHLRRARHTFQRFGVYTRRAPRPVEGLRTLYAHEPLGDPSRLRLMLTSELDGAWSEALARVAVLVPAPVSGELAAVQRAAAAQGAALVSSRRELVSGRWPSARHPSLVLVDAEPREATVVAARIKAHARDLRAGALLLGEELIDLRGVYAHGEVTIDGVVFWWTGELAQRERPTVVLEVKDEEAASQGELPPCALVLDATGLFTSARNGRSRVDEAAVVAAIRAALAAGWRHGEAGEPLVWEGRPG